MLIQTMWTIRPNTTRIPQQMKAKEADMAKRFGDVAWLAVLSASVIAVCLSLMF